MFWWSTNRLASSGNRLIKRCFCFIYSHWLISLDDPVFPPQAAVAEMAWVSHQGSEIKLCASVVLVSAFNKALSNTRFSSTWHMHTNGPLGALMYWWDTSLGTKYKYPPTKTSVHPSIRLARLCKARHDWRCHCGPCGIGKCLCYVVEEAWAGDDTLKCVFQRYRTVWLITAFKYLTPIM